jgi:hypothetical protein
VRRRKQEYKRRLRAQQETMEERYRRLDGFAVATLVAIKDYRETGNRDLLIEVGSLWTHLEDCQSAIGWYATFIYNLCVSNDIDMQVVIDDTVQKMLAGEEW